MSFPETPALTDTEKILAAISELQTQNARQTEAINSLGQNLQWLIDQAQGIFKVFSSPQFMNQILSGGIPNVGQSPAGPAEGPAAAGPAEGPAEPQF